MDANVVKLVGATAVTIAVGAGALAIALDKWTDLFEKWGLTDRYRSWRKGRHAKVSPQPAPKPPRPVTVSAMGPVLTPLVLPDDLPRPRGMDSLELRLLQLAGYGDRLKLAVEQGFDRIPRTRFQQFDAEIAKEIAKLGTPWTQRHQALPQLTTSVPLSELDEQDDRLRWLTRRKDFLWSALDEAGGWSQRNRVEVHVERST